MIQKMEDKNLELDSSKYNVGDIVDIKHLFKGTRCRKDYGFRTVYKCLHCGKLFIVIAINWKIKNRKYCSKNCQANYFRLNPLKHNEEYKRAMSKRMLGEKNPMYKKYNEEHSCWKGENIKYEQVHKWVKKYKPKPEFCENCKAVKPVDLANISQEYHRDVNDFKWLCRKCHMTEDGRLNNLSKYHLKTKLILKRGKDGKFIKSKL